MSSIVTTLTITLVSCTRSNTNEDNGANDNNNNNNNGDNNNCDNGNVDIVEDINIYCPSSDFNSFVVGNTYTIKSNHSNNSDYFEWNIDNSSNTLISNNDGTATLSCNTNGSYNISLKVYSDSSKTKLVAQSKVFNIQIKEKNNDVTNELVSFKTTQIEIQGINTKKASDYWNDDQWIKQKVIENKQQIFNFNVSSNFDWQANVFISNVIKDVNESNAGILTFNLVVYNANSNNSISSNFIFSGFMVEQGIEDAIEGVDYFILPGKDKNNIENRITIPSTKNREIISKYGTALLPWKETSKLTDEDLLNMFNLSGIVGWKNYDLGKRMITSDKFSSTMAI